MPRPSLVAYSKPISSFAFVTLILSSISCGQTQTSAPEVSMEVVMKTIHDYGQNHAGLLFPANSDKPTESAEVYAARINALLAQEDFARLEKIGRQNRDEKGLLLGGFWKNHEFFDAIGRPPSGGDLKDSDYPPQITKVKKWVAAYPESATARVALAALYDSYAGFARGTGLADSVSDGQWKLYHERTALAEQALLEAARLKDRDPHWYAVMQSIAQAESWDKKSARELFDQAVAFEPGYYHFYRLYSLYLLPQWYGEHGDVQALAEEASNRFSEPNSSIIYFQIMSSLICYCRSGMQELAHASYPKLRQGYVSLTQLYGNDNLVANRFAFVAGTFADKPATREALAHIETMLPEVWYTQQIFDGTREWANSP
jgi:hypothetical protein